MKNKNIVDPNIYFRWMSEVFNDFYTSKPKVELDLKKSISSIIGPLEWYLYDWLLLLTALEIKFNIDIPDEWGEDLELTLGELVSNLATLKVKADKSYGFRIIMALGYQNIDLDDDIDEGDTVKIFN